MENFEGTAVRGRKRKECFDRSSRCGPHFLEEDLSPQERGWDSPSSTFWPSSPSMGPWVSDWGENLRASFWIPDREWKKGVDG